MPGYELIDSEEENQISKVFKEGNGVLFRHGFENIRNNSFKVAEFEKKFATYFKTNYSLAVSSGTAALRVALAALNIGRGDEVITQSFTFVATVESIIESGATPICTEIDDTLNMDPSDLENKITKNTKAVIVVHMLGNPARISKIKDICKKNNIYLIEDTAWGCGGKLKDTFLGTWGDIGTFSFDFAKTITTGEGGMLVFKSQSIYEKAAAWHDHGHENNPKVPRWEDTRSSSGFNYRMSELQGAVGLAQLSKLDYIIKKHRENKKKIWDQIKDINSIKIRVSPEFSFETAESLIFNVENKKIASRCRIELLKNGLGTKILPEALTWHFAATWDHMKSLSNAHQNKLKDDFPVSTELLRRSVSIPINIFMSEDIPIKIKKSILKAIS